MDRAHVLAISIALAGLASAWAFLRTLTGQTGTGTQPFLETIGFAISTPAALVFLTYLTDVVPFRRYYTERGAPGLFGDFFLSVLAAAAVGLLGTIVAGQLLTSPVTLFLVGAVLTFAGAFVTFLARTRRYLEWEAADAAAE